MTRAELIGTFIGTRKSYNDLESIKRRPIGVFGC